MDASGATVLTDIQVMARIRAAKLRVTKSRLEVYRILRGLGGHRSVNDILVELQRKKKQVPRMSVYNAMAALHEAGLLMQADAGPGRMLYETKTVWHHHFVCSRCACIFDVPCVVGRKPCLRPSPKIGRAHEAQVIFRGICRNCSRKRR